MDNAFARRLRSSSSSRSRTSAAEALWQVMFPREAPLGEDIDFDFLAPQFQLAGGDIRNVALDAAFLAAQSGQVISMQRLVQALARQLDKQGRIASIAEFREYHVLLEDGSQ